MNDKRLQILLAGLALLSAAFLFLNFRAAMSLDQTETLLMTTDMGGNLPAAMQHRDPIRLVVEGDGSLARPLQQELREKMNGAGMGDIELVRGLEPAAQDPVLLVKVAEPGPLWMPFFAMSQFSVHAGYASDGDSTFMESIEKTHTSVAKAGVAHMYAEFDLSERSFGLISRPGYHHFLAEYLAQEIVTALKGMYKV